MGLLKKLCLPNATIFFLSQVDYIQPGGYGGVSDDNVDIDRAGYLLA